MNRARNKLYDRIISAYIDPSAENYDETIAGESAWQIFEQLSTLRRSLISWYPFQKDWEVLEIGAGFGNLTAHLADAAGRVDAVDMCDGPDILKRTARGRGDSHPAAAVGHTVVQIVRSIPVRTVRRIQRTQVLCPGGVAQGERDAVVHPVHQVVR